MIMHLVVAVMAASGVSAAQSIDVISPTVTRVTRERGWPTELTPAETREVAGEVRFAVRAQTGCRLVTRGVTVTRTGWLNMRSSTSRGCAPYRLLVGRLHRGVSRVYPTPPPARVEVVG